MKQTELERFNTIVIGGGQAGLSVGYLLAQRGIHFVILESNQRIGDSWRQRWDSLRLFSPARFDGLDGMPFPARGHYFPTKDEMGDFLESYARHFKLPVRTGVPVDGLSREGDAFLVTAGDQRFVADNVVVAMASYQKPKVPALAAELDPAILQMHSVAYRNPAQLKPGGVLLVGAGNSGSEIAMESVRNGHPTWMSGREVGHVPFRIESMVGRLLIPVVFRGVFHRLLTVDTPIGRKARPKQLRQGTPLIRVKPKDMKTAGIGMVPRVAGVKNGLPLLEDGRVLEVANVIWSTGFHPGFSWIQLPVHGELEPRHEAGIVPSEPGLYFVGLHFLYSMSSSMIHGVGRDAKRIVKHIASRGQAGRTEAPRMVAAAQQAR
ncbi:MAG: NAD(P)-binding domain-containing protein [Gemmatimonadota bacterium]